MTWTNPARFRLMQWSHPNTRTTWARWVELVAPQHQVCSPPSSDDDEEATTSKESSLLLSRLFVHSASHQTSTKEVSDWCWHWQPIERPPRTPSALFRNFLKF
jgi:hypothetical protein